MNRALKLAVTVVVLGGLILLVVPVLLMTAMLRTNPSGTEDRPSGFSLSSCAVSASSVQIGDLDPEQVTNARTIIAVGRSLNIPPRGWVIAIATALQESGLQSLDYGDRDSLGLMQQRPSMGWGTPAQVQDAEYAARAFYGGPGSPTSNPGLLSVRGWEEMPLWQAAQTVQRSAFPMAYADHEPLSTAIVERLSGSTAGCDSLATGPWRSPVQTGYTLTSSYGWRTSPTRGGADFHTGQDFARAEESPVSAVSRGVVVSSGWAGSYGNLVRVRHANGIESWYAHLHSTSVLAGDQVDAGELIGKVGSTGNSTGPHLHLEVRLHDEPIDPMPWLTQKGVHL